MKIPKSNFTNNNSSYSNGSLDMSPALRFFISLIFAAIASILLFGIGAIIAGYIYDINFSEFFSISGDLTNPTEIGKLKILIIAQTIALFGIIPLSIIIAFYKRDTKSFLRINSTNYFKFIPLVMLLMVLAIPFINFIGEFNGLIIEAFLGKENYFKDLLNQNEALSLEIVKADTISVLIYNIFIVAVLPGIFEEVCFRGAIQTSILKKIKNPHIAILITGILFGLLHMEFYGFIPRTMMGIFFGYLLYWSNNLWFPIIAHFTNNATIVIIQYYINRNVIDSSMDKVGADNDTMLFGLLSGIVVSFIGFYLFRLIQNSRDQSIVE